MRWSRCKYRAPRLTCVQSRDGEGVRFEFGETEWTRAPSDARTINRELERRVVAVSAALQTHSPSWPQIGDYGNERDSRYSSFKNMQIQLLSVGRLARPRWRGPHPRSSCGPPSCENFSFNSFSLLLSPFVLLPGVFCIRGRRVSYARAQKNMVPISAADINHPNSKPGWWKARS